MTNKYKILILLLLFTGICATTFAQQPLEKPKPPITRILFIFDASYSMIGKWESDSKINVARNILTGIVDSLEKVENVELALRCYGHQSTVPPQDCNDTRLEIPFAKGNSYRIKNRINSIHPKGTTPIARSLAAAANDFPKGDNVRNIILLITDGLEECDGDPCEVSIALQKKGITLKPFIIGIGKGADLSSLKCIGTFYDASNEQYFKNVMNVVINYVLNKTTCQVNLLDANKKPLETNVPMTFYDRKSGLVHYDFVHTLNNRGLPDTLTIDHLITYDIVVHTIPEVRLDSVSLVAGKHNIIAIDAPQGDIQLTVQGRDPFKDLNCIVRKAGDASTMHVQMFGSKTRYITGKYDLEVLCLPRITLKNIEVKPNFTTNVEISQPGLVNIILTSIGYGAIFLEDSDNLKFVYRLSENNNQETMYLQPGNYKIVYRAKSMRETIYTIQKSFKVISGMPITIKL